MALTLSVEQPGLPGMCPIADAVEKLAHDSDHSERGAIFTRREVVDFMLDLAGYTANRPIHRMRLLEPSFGGGEFLLAAVERLIALGADVEQASDYVPSALCYAMLLLHGSIHSTDPTQEATYLAGKTRADVHDAKDGAALDIKLATRRQRP